MDITFWMGKKVEVTHIYKRYRVSSKDEIGKIVHMRTWEIIPITPRVGWVVGKRTIYNGKYEPGSYSYDDPFPPALVNVKPLSAMLVAFWPTMRPVLVPYDMVCVEMPDGKPHHPCSNWKDEEREWLRNEMRSVKRDSKGRWLKG